MVSFMEMVRCCKQAATVRHLRDKSRPCIYSETCRFRALEANNTRKIYQDPLADSLHWPVSTAA
jgi:hypothetical protein